MKDRRHDLYKTENIHPGFSIDCVILGFHKGKLKVLLRKFDLKNYWALIGGFMLNEEDAEDAANRILKSRTGLDNIYLKQFHLFSNPARTIMEQNIGYVNENMDSPKDGSWLLRRFISLGYYALVQYDEIAIGEDKLLKWFSIDDLPLLYSDHESIIKKAIETIHSMLPVIPIGYELLPEKFTMRDLRKIYEIILGRSLDRRNFQRKVLAEGNVVQLNETKGNTTYNPSILYSFKKEKKNVYENFSFQIS